MRIIPTNCCGKMRSQRCQDCPVWRAREEAIARVAKNTDPLWAIEAFRSCDRVMSRHLEFTPDDIWLDLELRAVPEPHERRALGWITRILLKNGEVKVLDYTYSKRPVCHGRRIPIYQVMG